MSIQTAYNQLNNNNIVGMYYKILSEIFQGTLSDVMFHEAGLLENIAAERGISISYYKYNRKKDQTTPLFVLVTNQNP